MFLCRTVAGGRYGLDVDAMLDDIEPWQFDEWQALYRLEPWGDDWVQTARLIAAIENSAGANPPTNPADIVPTAENAAKFATNEIDDRQLSSVWKQRLGG